MVQITERQAKKIASIYYESWHRKKTLREDFANANTADDITALLYGLAIEERSLAAMSAIIKAMHCVVTLDCKSNSPVLVSLNGMPQDARNDLYYDFSKFGLICDREEVL